MTDRQWQRITNHIKDMVEADKGFAEAFQKAYDRLKAAGEASKGRKARI